MKKAVAGELSHVPHAIQRSTSHWFEFETEVPSQDENPDGVNRINRDLLSKAEAMDLVRQLVLDIDTEIPAWGEQERSACDGHFESACSQPFLPFNGEGNPPAAKLQSENVPSADDRDEALLPEVELQQEPSKQVVFRGDAALANPEIYEALEKRGVVQTFSSDSMSVPEPPNQPAIYQACGAGTAMARELPALLQPAGTATTTTHQLKRVRLHKPWWKVAVAAVATALVIALSIAYNNRRPASPVEPALQKSTALEQKVPFVSSKQLPTTSTTKPQTAPVATEEARDARTRHQRVRVGENEVDIGGDVTVRYFAPQQAVVPPARPVPSASQPADHSLPLSETSPSPQLAQ